MRPDERDLDEEIRGHLAISIQQRIERGEDPEQARVNALREFGYVPKLRDEMRRVWYSRWFDTTAALAQEMRVGWRSLLRAKGLAATVVITLALGIGANATMFGIADRLLLRGPTHVRDADRVVRVYFTEQPPGMNVFTTSGFGHVTYDILRRGATTFEQVATYAINDVVLGQGAEARQVRAGYTSAGFFDLLGVRPALGRFFTEQENAPNAAARVAVLSHGAWTS